MTAPAQARIYRSYVFLLLFFISRRDPKINEGFRKLFPVIAKAAAERGWTGYRAPPLFQGIVASTYSFNDGALLKFQQALKDAADPSGIMAPGRGGLCPKAMRETKE